MKITTVAQLTAYLIALDPELDEDHREAILATLTLMADLMAAERTLIYLDVREIKSAENN